MPPGIVLPPYTASFDRIIGCGVFLRYSVTDRKRDHRGLVEWEIGQGRAHAAEGSGM